MLYCWCYYKR